MIDVVALLIVLLSPVALVLALLVLADARQRRRARITTRQIRLTDAVHAELGALVAPVVQKPAFRPWRVIFALPEGRTAEVGRLIAIANRVVGAELASPRDLQIVFTRAAHAA